MSLEYSMSSNLQITQLAFNEVTLIPQLKLMLSKNWASSKFWTNLQTWCAIIPEQWIKKFKDTIILEVCTGTRVGEGKQTNGAAAAAALTHGPHSQPPPTSLCSSEKKPLLFPSTGEGGRSLGWTAAQLRHSTRHQKKKKQGPDFPPLSGVLSTHSPLQHTNTGSSVVSPLQLWLSFPAT